MVRIGISDSWGGEIRSLLGASPSGADVPIRGLLDHAYIAERRKLIGDEAQAPQAGRPPGGGTVYLCTADRDGMMVSYIQSNYMGFGSGVVVPEIGVSLHNRGAGEWNRRDDLFTHQENPGRGLRLAPHRA